MDYWQILLFNLPGLAIAVWLKFKLEKLKKENARFQERNIELRANNIQLREINRHLKNRDSEKIISDLEKEISYLKHIIAVYDWDKSPVYKAKTQKEEDL